VASLAQFDLLWLEAEEYGRVDALGGAEYRRVLAAWIEQGCPDRQLSDWIVQEANRPAQGTQP